MSADEDAPLDQFERLAEEHELADFDGGLDDVGEQAAWLKDKALTNDREGYTRTFVACFPGTRRVGAFYGLTSAAIARNGLPRAMRAHGSGTPSVIPATLIARLGVHASLQGQGVGSGLLVVALERCLTASESVAFRVIIVDAAGERARKLYEKFDFKPLSDDAFPNRLFLPVATAALLVSPPEEASEDGKATEEL